MFASNPFQPAEKERTFLRLSITGPSGSGKTYTALQLAKRIADAEGKKIAVLDTEGRSSLLYRKDFEFDAMHLRNNYDPRQYVDAIEAAGRYGYGVLVIDSLSHAWNGAGGVLSIVDEAGKKMKDNKWGGWATGRPLQNDLTSAIINAPIHLICTMRSKTAWEIQTDTNGKTKPVKIGLEAVQSDEMDYEFLMSLMLDMQHSAIITKTRFESYGIDKVLTLDDYDAFVRDALAWVTEGVKPSVYGLANEYAARDFARPYIDEQGLTASDLQTALKVERLRDFPGSVEEAHAAVAAYIAAQLADKPAAPRAATPAPEASPADASH